MSVIINKCGCILMYVTFDHQILKRQCSETIWCTARAAGRETINLQINYKGKTKNYTKLQRIKYTKKQHNLKSTNIEY